MKRTLTALVALGFLAVSVGPALAGGGCGGLHVRSVKADPSDRVAQGAQSTPVPTQTASTEDKSE